MRMLMMLAAVGGAALAQAAVSEITVTPTGVPAFKGRADVPIAQVSFTASQEAQAEKVRLDIRGTNPSDLTRLSLGDNACQGMANDAAAFTLPVKAGKNTFPLYATLSEKADLAGSLCVGGKRIRIGSVVVRPAQQISDRRLKDGRLRASKNFRIPGIAVTPKGTLVAVFDIRASPPPSTAATPGAPSARRWITRGRPASARASATRPSSWIPRTAASG